jgi:hypothetical protein
MSTTRKAAIDEIFGRIRSVLPDAATIISANNFNMVWPGVETNTPDSSIYWGRASTVTADEHQKALSGNVSEDNLRLFTVTGLVYVQLFCPQYDVTANEKGGDLATLFKNAFRKRLSSGKVTFRNARVQELPPENSAIRFNVVAEFEYDELG